MRESEEEFRRIFETANEGIWLLDVSGRTTRVNAKMAAMLAYSEAEMSGLALVDLLEDGARDEARANLADPSPGFFEGHDFLFRRRDGSELWADLSVTPIVNAAGERQGTLAMVTDITQRKQAEAERERLLEREQIARRDAEVANRLKDEFLATVSHELRAPLNAILGWVRLLRSNRLDETAAAGALETIERSAQNQNRLIEDLLDVSRIIAGKLRLDIRMIDLNVALKAALETIRPAAEAKEITLDPHFDPQAPLISGDSNRLQQVIWNLLSNAVKFTHQGGHISVTLAHTESKVEVTVVDNGQGIRPEFLPYVFDRFRQADSSSRRKHGGLGLGLAIVRHLVELHGGTVYVFSDGEGTGATFRVELPVPAPTIASTPASPQSPAARPPSNTEKVLDGLRVLVVDDHDDARKLVAQILKSHGATVAPASTAAEAYDQFVRQRPDILVSDIGMPEEDGYSLISRIRELEAGRGTTTPAIALTAYAQTSDRLRALGAGFQNHLTKPVEPLELVTAIASLTGRINRD
jgi:PAS domain S-box-containing protein